MRKNIPVTGNERLLEAGTSIVSKTDLKGRITYINADFVEVSGFAEAELIGQPHNIVRHPDMPPAAFEDMWVSLQAGRPWTGLVKNRCKNGDHYWVQANATPIREGGQVTGYMSVRVMPARDQVDAAEAAYQRIREGDRSIAVFRGGVVSTGLFARLARRLEFSLAAKLWFFVLWSSVALVAGAAGGLSGLIESWSVAAAGIALALLPMIGLAVSLHRGTIGRLAQTREVVLRLSEGRLDERIDSGTLDEIGAVRNAVRSMQIKLGFDLDDMRRTAAEAARVRQALENSDANVMIADADGRIVYLNRTVTEMFRRNATKLGTVFSGFDPDKLVGQNFDVFHRNPKHQRNLLAGLSSAHRTEVKVAGLTFGLVASPVLDGRGRRVGSVVEWRDRTAEVAVEEEIAGIVAAAGRGDLSQRLSKDGKEGFFARLADGINGFMGTSESAVKEVADVIGGLARGDLTQRITSDYEATFGQLREDVNGSLDQLTSLIGDIRAAIEQIGNATREIAKGNQDLSSRTEEQASALEETAASMEEITSTVKQSSENSREANRLAGEASTVASRGGEVVGRVVHTMTGMTESSKKIADIIGVIDGIAFQTNILALNAAVEAARAGEQGRGFAVVASEVRTLAQRSASAAKEIKGLIEESVERVETGSRLVNEAGATIDDLVKSVERVVHVISEITVASQEQSTGLDQINTAVSQMDEVTQQNAALVEEAAAAAESLEEQANSLSRSVSVFRIRADELAARAAGRRAARLAA